DARRRSTRATSISPSTRSRSNRNLNIGIASVSCLMVSAERGHRRAQGRPAARVFGRGGHDRDAVGAGLVVGAQLFLDSTGGAQRTDLVELLDQVCALGS